jgi:glutamyl-tRNA synthetase
MTRVRFAPSPTGTLHVGNALSAIANRRLGDFMLLRIDDTDSARNVEGGEQGIFDDLRWLGIEWDEGPVRQSERAGRHMEAAREADLPQRFEGVMLWRDDGSPTFHLASVVDDVDFRVTHVIRGSDHRPNEELHAALHRALGTQPPQVVHHGLVVGDDGKKLSKRATRASLPRRCAPTWRSSTCRSTTCTSISTASARCRSTCSRASTTKSSRRAQACRSRRRR